MPLGVGAARKIGKRLIGRFRDQPLRDSPAAPIVEAIAKRTADKINPPKEKTILEKFMDWLLQLIPGIIRALRSK